MKRQSLKGMNSNEWNKKGEELWQNDDIERALQSFQESTKLDPLNVAALLNEGAALVSLKRTAEGLKIINQALEQQPNDVVGLVWKAIADYRLGNKELGLKSVDKALELDPNERFAQIIKAYIEKDQEIAL